MGQQNDSSSNINSSNINSSNSSYSSDRAVLSWWIVLTVQLTWLLLQLAFVYQTHYIDQLQPVKLSELFRLRDKTLLRPSDRRLCWTNLIDQGDSKRVLWWQNWHDDTLLRDLPVLGTHQSASYTINNVFSLFAKTQRYTIIEQLNRGVRALDIRLKLGKRRASDTDAELYAFHDFVDLNLSWRKICSEIEAWLKVFQQEGLLLMIRDENYRNHAKIIGRACDSMSDELRGRLVLNNKDFTYATALTVGDLRGRVLLLNYNGESSLPWGDNREFRNGGFSVSDVYDNKGDIRQKILLCQEFYRKIKPSAGNTDVNDSASTASFMRILFTSRVNRDVFRSIRLDADLINRAIREWMYDERLTVLGCVMMQDWIE